MSRAVERVYQDTPLHALFFLEAPRHRQLLREARMVWQNLAGMGLARVDEERVEAAVGVLRRQGIHGWARHRAVRSGVAAELQHQMVGAPERGERDRVPVQISKRDIRRALASVWPP